MATSSPPDTPTPDQIAGTITRLRDVDAQLDDLAKQTKQLEERRAELAADLQAALGVGEHAAPKGFGLDGATVRIGTGTPRFNAARAREVLPAHLHARICESVARAELAKAVLVGDLAPLLELCKAEGKPSVRVELPADGGAA